MAAHKLRIGILGAGEVAQVIHLPTLSLLSDLYTLEATCDISLSAAQHCAAKFHIPISTTNPDVVIHNEAVDLVFVLTSDEFHEQFVVQALKAGKDVFVEKPLTLSLASGQRIVDAEKGAGGKRVFVGYERRYAPSFLQAFKREIASIPTILYARVRDFSGPNGHFVAQSGTFQFRSTDDVLAEADQAREKSLQEMFAEAFGDKEMTPARQALWRFLGSLGSHDISLMREVLGSPESIGAVTANAPFYSAVFDYRNRDGLDVGNGPVKGAPFAVMYESGIDAVPNFDAHLALYGEKKRVSIHYDSAYVKGLAIKVKVDELNEHDEIQSREIVSSYEDSFTAELRELYACLVQGKEIKTTSEDAMQDLRIFDAMFKAWEGSRI